MLEKVFSYNRCTISKGVVNFEVYWAQTYENIDVAIHVYTKFCFVCFLVVPVNTVSVTSGRLPVFLG